MTSTIKNANQGNRRLIQRFTTLDTSPANSKKFSRVSCSTFLIHISSLKFRVPSILGEILQIDRVNNSQLQMVLCSSLAGEMENVGGDGK